MADTEEKMSEILVARQKMFGKMGDARTGGKGTVRRKKRTVHKTQGSDDKRLQNTLKRLGLNNIPGIEEVNFFLEDGNVIHFTAPKVQANIAANTYVVNGHGDNKALEDLLPNILHQLGADNLQHLGQLAQEFNAGQMVSTEENKQEDDEDVPDLVETFDMSA
eukprot:Platyproteum_vivax@DN9077_c0_g1_i1.p1